MRKRPTRPSAVPSGRADGARRCARSRGWSAPSAAADRSASGAPVGGGGCVLMTSSAASLASASRGAVGSAEDRADEVGDRQMDGRVVVRDRDDECRDRPAASPARDRRQDRDHGDRGEQHEGHDDRAGSVGVGRRDAGVGRRDDQSGNAEIGRARRRRRRRCRARASASAGRRRCRCTFAAWRSSTPTGPCRVNRRRARNARGSRARTPDSSRAGRA